MKYTLGIKCGGQPGDPKSFIDQIVTVEADSLKEAKDKWSVITERDKDKYNWDPVTQTFWSCTLVEVGTCPLCNNQDSEIRKLKKIFLVLWFLYDGWHYGASNLERKYFYATSEKDLRTKLELLGEPDINGNSFDEKTQRFFTIEELTVKIL